MLVIIKIHERWTQNLRVYTYTKSLIPFLKFVFKKRRFSCKVICIFSNKSCILLYFYRKELGGD